ncbi:FAD-dependent oxidoreductase [Streptomyces sp. ISL-12]|uniref:NAD(P)/FAD-dependent oxidoreductase n=1 Tax=Streptomyces sp. ISL-12 TaxID=2819177 RepID=UPI001BEB376E|nr:FAD-dependent oxidoreductase [Streptomyces sp. ISL-12]MBT2410982.1 FAD-dependent oxidoreductase [Streptomyces sp. ISL-12]
MTRTLLVVGHGMVGHRLMEQLRARDPARTWRVVAVGEEHHLAYDRVGLSAYLDGKSRGDLTLVGADLLNDPRVDLLLGSPVTEVDRAARTARTAHGAHLRYDALVLATGSRPFVPPVPGHDQAGCFVYRTFDDLDALRAAARPGRPGVVVGGGLLGLEAANALRLLGMRARVVENGAHLMPAQLDAGAAAVLHRHVAGLGLGLHCGTSVASVDAGPDGRVTSVTLGDGTVLDADVVVFAAGVRPRDELAGPLGLARGGRGGFAVDAFCRTADERVWAIGECAAVDGRCHGLVAPGYRMADSVARQLTGDVPEPFDATDTPTTLKLLGVTVATVGSVQAGHGQAVEAVFAEGTDRYAKVLLSRDGGALLGAVVAGGTGPSVAIRSLVGHRPPPDLEHLLLPRSPSAAPPERTFQS